MRYLSRITIVTVFAVALFLPTIVAAQDSTSKRLSTIKANCQSIHSSVDLQRRRDLVARTNRGREYESMNKQLDAFNQRIKNNKFNSQEFDTLFGSFKRQTTQFRDAYENYDDSLNTLLKADCQNDPSKFSDNLNQARQLRKEVSKTVQRINSSLIAYRKEVVKLKEQNQPANSTGNNR